MEIAAKSTAPNVSSLLAIFFTRVVCHRPEQDVLRVYNAEGEVFHLLFRTRDSSVVLASIAGLEMPSEAEHGASSRSTFQPTGACLSEQSAENRPFASSNGAFLE